MQTRTTNSSPGIPSTRTADPNCRQVKSIVYPARALRAYTTSCAAKILGYTDVGSLRSPLPSLASSTQAKSSSSGPDSSGFNGKTTGLKCQATSSAKSGRRRALASSHARSIAAATRPASSLFLWGCPSSGATSGFIVRFNHNSKERLQLLATMTAAIPMLLRTYCTCLPQHFPLHR